MGNCNRVPRTLSSTAQSTHPPHPNIGRVFGQPIRELSGNYVIGRKLSSGQDGVTQLVTHKTSGRKFACKSIVTGNRLNENRIKEIRREVEIMNHLTGPSGGGDACTVKLYEVVEDQLSVNLIMDWCAGGQLFDRIIARRHYSEREAAKLCRKILTAVQFCHSKGVMHRDLKPENLLLLTSDDDSPVVATDFGLSVVFKPDEPLKDLVGSAYYVAPEVLRRNYDAKADVWSAGVILYVLLSGAHPFLGDGESGIMNSVLHGKLDFKSNPWPSISTKAKDLVKKMLTKDPKDRLSALDALNHPWLKEGEAPDEQIDIAVLTKMKQFSAMNILKKVVLRVIAEYLPEEESRVSKEMFKLMDTNKDGNITSEEFKAGLQNQKTNIKYELEPLMKAADVDGNGTISEIEFIAATMNMQMKKMEDHLSKAFNYLDVDGNGYITKDELKQVLEEYNVDDEDTIMDLIAEVDIDKDGQINCEEFLAMMKKGNHDLEAIDSWEINLMI